MLVFQSLQSVLDSVNLPRLVFIFHNLQRSRTVCVIFITIHIQETICTTMARLNVNKKLWHVCVSMFQNEDLRLCNFHIRSLHRKTFSVYRRYLLLRPSFQWSWYIKRFCLLLGEEAKILVLHIEQQVVIYTHIRILITKLTHWHILKLRTTANVYIAILQAYVKNWSYRWNCIEYREFALLQRYSKCISKLFDKFTL